MMQWKGHLGTYALALATLTVAAVPALAWQQAPAPIERRAPAPGHAAAARRQVMHGEHLAEWMNQHGSLSPQQQQQALESEPGFHDLPPQTQQRMLQRLNQLDAMAPAQRQRVIARTEAMERLTPEQRGEVRTAMSQLGALPFEDRRQVAQLFRSLRDLPANQRIPALQSGRFPTLVSEQDRAVLMNLLRVEPMLPPPSGVAPTGPQRMPPSAQAFH